MIGDDDNQSDLLVQREILNSVNVNCEMTDQVINLIYVDWFLNLT